MARRNDHSKEEIQEMAIQAGIDILTKEGISGFSSRAVAREIGYTVGTLYNVFSSQDELLIHIKARILDELATFITEKTNPRLKGAAAIKQLAKHYLAYASTYYHHWQLLFEHHSPSDYLMPDWYTHKIKKMFTPLENYLSTLANPKQVELAAKTLWASIHGICSLGLTGKLDVVKVGSIQKLIDSLIDNYLLGVMHD